MKSILIEEIEFKGKLFLQLSLNRPSLRNAFDPNMISEITQVFKQLNANNLISSSNSSLSSNSNNKVNLNEINFKKYRGVILKGEGKVFCAGADLQWMESMVNFTYEENQNDALVLFEMFESISNCSIPVIGLVHGAAMGGALGLIAACDIVIAEAKTQFCFSEVKLGIAPAVISAFIKQKISGAFIDPWMISGRVFDSTKAINMGLIHEIFEEGVADKDNINEHLTAWMGAFIDAAPQAVIETKKLVKNIQNYNWSLQKKITTDLIAQRRVSDEGQEGLKSFLNKNTPSWR